MHLPAEPILAGGVRASVLISHRIRSVEFVMLAVRYTMVAFRFGE